MGGRAFAALAVGLVWACVGCRARPELSGSNDQVRVRGLDLGMVPLGTTARGSIWLSADGASPLVVTAIAPPPDCPSGFSVDAPVPLTISGGSSAPIPVALAATAAGDLDIPLHLALDPGGELVAHVTAQVVPVELTAQTSLAFGEVALGAVRSLSLDVSNGSPLAVAAPLAIAAGGEFELRGLPSSGRLLVPANGSASVTVAFAPTVIGGATGELSIAAYPGGPATQVALSGNGIATAVSVAPASLDFGDLPLGKQKTLGVTVGNAGDTPLSLSSVAVAAGARAFSVSPGGALSVPARGTVSLQVTFVAESPGPAQGTLLLETSDPDSPRVAVPLSGAGGGPSIAVLPPSLDFGAVPAGTSRTLEVVVENVGDCGAGVSSLSVSSVQIAGGGGAFTVSGPGATSLAAGQSETLEVTFAASASATVSAALQIGSDDAQSPLVSVPLTGTGHVPLPCLWTAAPSQVDFGLLAPGQSATLSFALGNVGIDQCVVSGLGMASGSSAAFQLLGPQPPQVVLNPGDFYDLWVRYSPTAAGEDVGQVAFGVSNPEAPSGQVPLFGVSRPGCLAISPTDLQFGDVGVSCPARGKQVTLSNSCQGPVTVASATVGGGTARSGEFALAPALLPTTLQAGASMLLTVLYSPSPQDPDDDPDNAALSIDDGEGQLRTVGLSGIGVQSPDQTDTFTQQAAPKVDVLMVIDNSGSFDAQQAAMRANASDFLQAALASGVDFHLGVTTTGIEPATGSWSICPGGANGGEAGRLFPVDDSSPRILTSQTPNVVGDLANNVVVGTCHWDEQPFQAAVDALTPPLSTSAKDPGSPWPADGNLGFLRDDALLNIIFIQDDDDESQVPVDHFTSILKEVKGAGNEWMITASAVTAVQGCNNPQDLGVRYFQLVGEMGGQIFSVCTQDWGGLLGQLGAQAFSLRLRFPLSGTPLAPGQIQVAVGGQAVPAGAAWSYDAKTNEVVFSPGSAPPGGSQVQISYAVACP